MILKTFNDQRYRTCGAAFFGPNVSGRLRSPRKGLYPLRYSDTSTSIFVSGQAHTSLGRIARTNAFKAMTLARRSVGRIARTNAFQVIGLAHRSLRRIARTNAFKAITLARRSVGRIARTNAFQVIGLAHRSLRRIARTNAFEVMFWVRY